MNQYSLDADALDENELELLSLVKLLLELLAELLELVDALELELKLLLSCPPCPLPAVDPSCPSFPP